MAEFLEGERPPVVLPEHLVRQAVVEDWCKWEDLERTARRDGYTHVAHFTMVAEIHAYGEHLHAVTDWIRAQGLSYKETRHLRPSSTRPVWRDLPAFVELAEAWLRDVRPTIKHHAVCTILDYERGL